MSLPLIPNTNPISMMSSIYRQHQNQQTIQGGLDKNLPSTLSIFNSLTGDKVVTSSYNFHSMDSLKHYIADCFEILPENLFLLTPFGIKLRFNMLVHEEINEIFAFDRKFFNVHQLSTNDSVSGMESSNYTNELLKELDLADVITLIKPMGSPIISDDLPNIVDNLNREVSKSKHVNSSDLDIGGLRLLLNSLRRNSGWASALLSDFKKTIIPDDQVQESHKYIQNILTSLNVLIQYVGLVFKGLEKKFNELIDRFIVLQTNTMADKWKDEFKKLEKITFSYFNKVTSQKQTLKLSELMSIDELEQYSENSKQLHSVVTKQLMELRSKIEYNIIAKKQGLVKEYDLYKIQFMKSSNPSDREKSIEDSRSNLKDLEANVNNLVESSKYLPSFDDLISTTSSNSTTLSQDSINNIKSLVQLYDTQAHDLVPKISGLATKLYDSQSVRLSFRRELQEKLVTTTLVTITKIQWNIMNASSTLDTGVLKNLNSLKECELQLSVVTDLPLVFGVWSIANLNNLKYAMSMNKMINKTNEIFEMLKFIEINNRTKWMNKFVLTNGGNDKLSFLKLTDESKFKFINEHVLDLKLVPSDTLIVSYNEGKSHVQPQQISEQQQQLQQHQKSPRHQHQNTNNYLNSFNKLIQNINGLHANVKGVYSPDTPQLEQPSSPGLFHTSPKHQATTNLENSKSYTPEELFFMNIANWVTIKDIVQYIAALKVAKVDTTIVRQLENFTKEFNSLATLSLTESNKKMIDEDGDEVVMKRSNNNELGSFDSNDSSFIKIFKKFIKSFEIDGITINILINNDVNGNFDGPSNTKSNDVLIKGYEHRIKNLENLLHQQTFKQFNDQWSHQTARASVPPENNADSGEEKDDGNGVSKTVLFNEDVGLGRKAVGLPPSHFGEKINKLIEENKKLAQELESLKTKPMVDKLTEFEEKLKTSDLEIEYWKNLNDSKEKKIKSLESQLSSISKSNIELCESNKEFEKLCNELRKMNSDLLENMSHKEVDFAREAKVNQEEINELKLRVEEMQEDLSNLIEQNKQLGERVISKDSLLLQCFELLQNLYSKLNILSDEVFNSLTCYCLLLESIGLLLIRSVDKDGKPGLMSVKRVKGLRNKKKQIKQQKQQETTGTLTDLTNTNQPVSGSPSDPQQTLDDDVMDHALLEVVSSEVVPQAKDHLHWINRDRLFESSNNIEDSKIVEIKDTEVHKQDADYEEEDEEKGQSASLCEESVIEKKMDVLLHACKDMDINLMFTKFMDFNHVDSQLLVDKVYRRFNDVEMLARRLQKDKNQQKLEIKTLNQELLSRLSIKNFNVGDLVLFLKTLTPASSSMQQDINNGKLNGMDDDDIVDEKQPWAAFNIGSPNYYLNNFKVNKVTKKKNDNYIRLKNRDWFVGRIINIETRIVTDENFESNVENPLKLTKGLTWHFVQAKEEKFGNETS